MDLERLESLAQQKGEYILIGPKYDAVERCMVMVGCSPMGNSAFTRMPMDEYEETPFDAANAKMRSRTTSALITADMVLKAEAKAFELEMASVLR